MENIKTYLLENKEELKNIVAQLNDWNGVLEHLAVYENDEEFFEMFFHDKPMEAVRAAHYGDYRFNDYYVRFNGYANLESFDEWELDKELEESIDEIVSELIENKDHIDLNQELDEMLYNL